MTRPTPEPTEVERLANLLLGPDEHAPALPRPAGIGPRAALEQAVLPALERPPCVVSFSGGRDSSAVLGVATAVARRHGLADPVAVTLRFPEAAGSDEAEWQKLVLDHLGVRQEIIELHDELDLLGPIATGFLRRHGARWPGNGYVHTPILAAARGGTVLTGVGGDELLGTRSTRRNLLAARVPRRIRAARWRRRAAPAYSWLTPRGLARVHEGLMRDELTWPGRWDRGVHHWHASRAFASVSSLLGLVAEGHDVTVVNPFLDPHFMAELAQRGGPGGFAGRDAAMRALVGDVLPEPVTTRTTKAHFSAALWGPAARAFAREWQGEGLDEDLVVRDALRAVWQSELPDSRSVLALHTAWLSEAR